SHPRSQLEGRVMRSKTVRVAAILMMSFGAVAFVASPGAASATQGNDVRRTQCSHGQPGHPGQPGRPGRGGAGGAGGAGGIGGPGRGGVNTGARGGWGGGGGSRGG